MKGINTTNGSLSDERFDYLVTVSIVSHSQVHLVKDCLADITKFCDPMSLEVILTINVYEDLEISTKDYLFSVTIIRNKSPKGFGTNHNAAFSKARGNYFCVLNPDIRLDGDPFRALSQGLLDQSVGLMAPLVLDSKGGVADSARRFPSVFSLFQRLRPNSHGNDYFIGSSPLQADWIAGMFMLFRSSVFKELGGFDKDYFLYCEDVDICARLYLKGLKCVLDPRVKVFHLEQRMSRRKFRFFCYHFGSFIRFFTSTVYLRVLSKSVFRR